ncbi:MAG: hypothetical protein IPM29_10180 [Planctomycetes bacterium]|nr:hypothetical protein [Planctomycetota bacterium]
MHPRFARSPSPFLCVLAPLVLAAAPRAQILPGQSICAVTVGTAGEMWQVDHLTGTATQLTISAALVTARPNCVTMLDPVSGYIGTNPVGVSGDIYAILVAGTTIVETQLNSTPTQGSNVAQLAGLGGRLYFTTQDAAGAGGWLQSIPAGGGAVQAELDITTVGATGLANACCAMGGKIYVATFNSSAASTATSPGELIEYDPGTMAGRLVMTLPPGGFDPSGNPWNTGIVNMLPDPLNPGTVVLQGVYGDLLYIDPATATIVRQDWTGTKNAAGTGLASGTVNSFAWDPIAQDWVVGTRTGTIERWVGEQQAQNKISGVGSTTAASLGGIHYFPMDRGVDVSYGGGCRGNEDWEPTDSSFGAPIAGNMGFRFGLFGGNGGDAVVAVIGISATSVNGVPLPLDLAFAGLTPGCFLRTDAIVSLGATLGGTGAGNGQVTIPLPLPMSVLGARFYRQWFELQTVPTNPAGAVVSNARMTVIR